jgi:phospholipid/cholesterol/gamma-HCH transport system substrate-binding protein
MHRNIIETVMGGVVLLVAVFFVVFAFSSTDVGTVSGYTLTANFTNADGLRPGTEVRISGVKVGTVTAQTLNPETFVATVTMSIEDRVKLPTDSSARVLADGLLGDKFIMIDPGGAEEMLPPGGRIAYTQASINIVDLIGRFVFSGTQAQGKSSEE